MIGRTTEQTVLKTAYMGGLNAKSDQWKWSLMHKWKLFKNILVGYKWLGFWHLNFVLTRQALELDQILMLELLVEENF